MDNGSSREVVKSEFLAKAISLVETSDAARRRMEADKAEMETAQAAFQSLVTAAKVWKIDLIQEFDVWFKTKSGAHGATPLPLSKATAPKVRDFILEQAARANGDPVRASALRRAYFNTYGVEVHEKTFGMTLFRLSKEGSMRRSGRADWYLVPEGTDMFPANQNSERAPT
jgi:hypothetical protein